MDKYKQYIEIEWWNQIQKRDIDNWIKNFGSNEKLAEMILDNVIYYNTSQLKTYTRFLINELKAQVYEQVMKQSNFMFVNDEVLHCAWDEYRKKTKFIPAVIKEDATSSAFVVLRQWRSLLEGEAGSGEHLFSGITDMEKHFEMGVRRFILVDDFSGSGSQILDVLKQRIVIRGNSIEIGKLPDYVEDVEIIIAVYVVHSEAIKALNQEYSKVKIIYVDLVNDDLNYLNEASIMYRNLKGEEAKNTIVEIKNLCDTVLKENTEL